MDPDNKVPAPDGGMPPMDGGLREAMEALAQRQRRCDGLRKCLLLLSVIALLLWEPLFGLPLAANLVVTMTWGSRLAGKAGELAREAYPWIHDKPVFFDPPVRFRGSRWGYGYTACERIRAEAQRTGDTLTAGLLRFAERNGFWPFMGLLAPVIVGVLVHMLAHIWGRVW